MMGVTVPVLLAMRSSVAGECGGGVAKNEKG
jgi:hypothetical protein